MKKCKRVERRAVGVSLALACVCILLAASFGGCAGYQIGNHGLYPSHIRTVYVPIFSSTSFRRNLGEQLTEAVIKKIEENTNYKVVGTRNADSTLKGTIIGETKRLVVQTRGSDPREVEINLQVAVTWIDQRNREVLCEGEVPLPPELTDVGAASGAVPEVGQSVATAQQQAVQRLAEQIVGLMEAPW